MGGDSSLIMPLNFPIGPREIKQRMRSDVKAILPDFDPFLRNSLIDAIITANSGRFFDSYTDFQEVLRQCFVTTATGVFLEIWGSIKDITRLPATSSSGNIVVTGIASTIIPVGTEFRDSQGEIYNTSQTESIINTTQNVTSLTSSGTTALAQTSDAHLLATGVNVTISGAVETEYNGTFTITVISPDTFSYTLLSTTTSPATGVIVSDSTSANIPVVSAETGGNTNLLPGAQVTIVTPIAGADNIAFVDIGSIGGGSDVESDDDLRARILFSWQNPATPFNDSGIELTARTVAGVTRVFIFEPTSETSDPLPGQVKIYFMRDNDENPIPSAAEVEQVKDAILEIKPAHTLSDDVFVLAPTPVVVDFEINSLVPNTQTMKNSIISNLKAFFQDQTSVGVNLTQNAYTCAIQNTIDSESGDIVVSFSLTNPVGDIPVSIGEIAVLGDVVFI